MGTAPWGRTPGNGFAPVQLDRAYLTDVNGREITGSKRGGEFVFGAEKVIYSTWKKDIPLVDGDKEWRIRFSRAFAKDSLEDGIAIYSLTRKEQHPLTLQADATNTEVTLKHSANSFLPGHHYVLFIGKNIQAADLISPVY